jgi:Glycosyltransferase
MIYADARRIGDHGIGRFARHVLGTLDYCPIRLETDPDSPLDPWRLSRALRTLTSDDVFFSPGYNPPLSSPAPFLITLHDLNHLDRTENSSVLKRLYYEAIVKRACHQASKVLTVSEFSRGRIIEWSGVAASKVVNVGCGVDNAFHVDGPKADYPFPYLLCVSNRRLHKNEFRTIEAFAASKTAAQLHLLFTGDPSPEIMKCVEGVKLGSRVHFAGVVPEKELPSLYRGAQGLIFASLYEGFGLPAVEAMACGIPVIASNTTALPEVAGDAALLVDPMSVEEIADAIGRLAADDSLRQILRERGLERSAKFTWAGTAARVQQAIENAKVPQK